MSFKKINNKMLLLDLFQRWTTESFSKTHFQRSLVPRVFASIIVFITNIVVFTCPITSLNTPPERINQLLNQLHILGTMLRQDYIILSVACITYPRMTRSNLMRFTDIPMGILSSTWTCKEKGCFVFFFSSKKPTVGTMFFGFLSKVSWNLILLILLCLFLPPPLS